MSEMVERVARALCPDAWLVSESGLHALVCWDTEQERARHKARAAIAAMREPTDAMVEAVDIRSCERPVVAWYHMIDEALK